MASLLFLALTLPQVGAVQINGALLCRPWISSDNLNEFVSSLTETFNLILQSDICHPDELLKIGSQSIIIVKPKPGETSTDLVNNCNKIGSQYSPNSIS